MSDDWTESDGSSDYYGDDSATFGDRLSAARQAAGLSAEELAAKLGVGIEVIEKWEDDRAEPRANRVMMLAGMLNVSVSWLLSGSGDGVTPPELAGRARRGENPCDISIVADDLEAARRFYCDGLGCELARSDDVSQSFNFFGHHLTTFSGDSAPTVAAERIAVGEPAPSFGVILGWQSWRALIERLRSQGVEFALEPTINDVGSRSERGVFVLADPAGNVLAFRSFRDSSG